MKSKKENKQKEKAETIKVQFDKSKAYSIDEAIKFTKELSKTKFDATVEAHFRLGIDPRKGDQQVRTAVSLPHGTGKTIKVAAFVTEEKEKEVKKTIRKCPYCCSEIDKEATRCPHCTSKLS